MSRLVAILAFLALAGALLLGSHFLSVETPPYPPVPDIHVPTPADLLVLRTVLIERAHAGHPIGLLPSKPGPADRLSSAELALLSGRVSVLLTPTRAPALYFSDDPDPALRDLVRRNTQAGSASLNSLGLPPYMAFSSASPGPSGVQPYSEVTFSLPGYHRDRAVVYVEVAFKIVRDNTSLLIRLERRRGRWVVLDTTVPWIS